MLTARVSVFGERCRYIQDDAQGSGCNLQLTPRVLYAKPQPPPPPASANWAAVAVSSSQINLSWTASTTPGVTYNVYKGATKIATGLSATTYQQTGLASSTTYTCTVTATSAGGEASASN